MTEDCDHRWDHFATSGIPPQVTTRVVCRTHGVSGQAGPDNARSVSPMTWQRDEALRDLAAAHTRMGEQ